MTKRKVDQQRQEWTRVLAYVCTGAFASASATARMKEQAAAAQAARAIESERILHRERAKDAEWRRKASTGELFVEVRFLHCCGCSVPVILVWAPAYR